MPYTCNYLKFMITKVKTLQWGEYLRDRTDNEIKKKEPVKPKYFAIFSITELKSLTTFKLLHELDLNFLLHDGAAIAH